MILLFTGLFFLLIGFLLNERKAGSQIRIIGWIAFGIFWLTQIPHFISIGDTFNAIFGFMGFLLFSYFAIQEVLNIKWGEYLHPLNYIAGITSAGGLFYYSIERIEPLAKGLIYIVATQSVWIFNLFGYNAEVLSFNFDQETLEFYLPIEGTQYGGKGINIILACTGIQSIAIFIGILLVTKPNRKIWVKGMKKLIKEPISEDVKSSKLRSWLWSWKINRMKKVIQMSDKSRYIRIFFYTVPVIYVLNLFRNALIMYGHVNATLGPDTFEIAHNWLSKFLSLLVLIVLVFLVFELLPEFREGILGIFDLQYRLKPGLIKDGYVDLDKIEKLEERVEKITEKKRGRNDLKIKENKSKK